MASLIATGISKSFGSLVVLRDASVTISPETRLGVVGANGAGKSTLLRILAGIESPDEGRIERAPASATVGYLPQESDARPGEIVGDYLARRTGVAGAEAEVDRLAPRADTDPHAYTEALERYVTLGGGDLQARAEATCADLGFGPDVLARGMETLSGGQRARAALASILLARFDLFLLDEPTNDLDYDGLERLEGFVRGLRGGAVIVSHDRAFLERTVTRVLEIEEGTKRVVEYGGGYAGYLERKEHARAQAYETYERYADERDALRERARTIRAWSEKGVRKQKKDPPDNEKLLRKGRIARTEKQASKVRAVERRLERLEPVEKPFEPWDLRMSLEPEQRAGQIVVRLEQAVVQRGAFRLGPTSVEIHRGERVAIAGPNGSGKTTLIGAMLGRLPLTSGRRWMGPSVVVGELDQGRELFDRDAKLLDAFVRVSGLLAEDARTLLAKFGLGADHVLRVCATLSPGERTRATLALFMARGVNLLVLDEPTNHLDLPAIEELESALETYDGTLLLVTHDRRFRENVRLTRTVDLG